MISNKYLLLCLFISISLGAFSQSKLRLGLKAGANISSLTNANLEVKANAYGGIFLNVTFSDFYEFQPEILYSGQGGSPKNEGGNLALEYISIGIANNFFINKDGHFYLSLKPSIDLDIDDTFIGLVNRGEDEGNEATFVDITIGGGLGYRFDNGLAIEVLYKRGLVDVYSGSFHSFESEQYENENQFNSVFQLGLSYRFDWLKKED